MTTVQRTSAPKVGSSRHGRLFWAGAVVGGGVMAFGVVGLLGDQSRHSVQNWALFLVGLDVLHDAAVAPLVCATAALVARTLPTRVRVPAQAGLALSALVLLLAGLPLAHTARAVGNPTIQPLDYGSATLTALGIVWGSVVVATVLRRRLRDRAGSQQPI